MEAQKILLTIEFAVLAGALLSVFIRYQLKRTSKPARETRLRQSRAVERPSSSEAMSALVNCLVREKNLIPRKASDVRLNLILEAFLERRQVPASARLPFRPASE